MPRNVLSWVLRPRVLLRYATRLQLSTFPLIFLTGGRFICMQADVALKQRPSTRPPRCLASRAATSPRPDPNRGRTVRLVEHSQDPHARESKRVGTRIPGGDGPRPRSVEEVNDHGSKPRQKTARRWDLPTTHPLWCDIRVRPSKREVTGPRGHGCPGRSLSDAARTSGAWSSRT